MKYFQIKFNKIPVFSRPSLNPSLSRVLDSPVTASSPILPAGKTSRPMLMDPLRKVPVVKTTPEAWISSPFPLKQD